MSTWRQCVQAPRVQLQPCYRAPIAAIMFLERVQLQHSHGYEALEMVLHAVEKLHLGGGQYQEFP